jgi:glycosyltransferase involved in cell wall biosynthesis
MHLLYVSNGYSPHDRNFLTALGAGMERLSFLPLGITSDEQAAFHAEMPGRAALLSLDAYPVDLQTAFPALASLSLLLEKVRPDVTLAGPLHSGAFACAMAKCPRLVSMSWAFDILVEGKANVALGEAIRYALDHSCAAVYDADVVASRIRELASADLQMFSCQWGVDLTEFSFAPHRRRILLPAQSWERQDVVFSNRKWSAAYDVSVAIAAFAEAHSRNSNLRMVLAGDGPLHEDMLRAIHAFGLHDLVYLTGRLDRTQTAAYLQACDVYLSCAPSDGSSVSLLEAMACGAIPIVVDAPGNREWLTVKSGWLVPAGQPGGFAEAIESAFATDDNIRREMAAVNRQQIESRADWRSNSSRLIDFLRQIGEGPELTGE